MELHHREDGIGVYTMARDRTYNRLIQSAEWLRIRKRKLNRNPLCEDCLKRETITAATEIHHITPCEMAISDEELRRLMYDESNLSSLCRSCHHERHKMLKSHSKEAVAKNRERMSERFEKRFLQE